MLKRIEVKNFKSLKHLDYKCAKLNLLMGLNGAGKSSFVQSLLFLRALDRHVAEECYEMPLREIVGDDDEGIVFEDLKYCYAKPEEDVVFRVDFDIENQARKDVSAVGQVTRVVRSCHCDEPVISVWDPDCIKEVDSSLNLIEQQANQLMVAEADELAQLDKWQTQVLDETDLRMQEVMRQKSPLVEKYRSLWKRTNLVSAFRGRPKQIHHGAPSGSWLFGVRFNPEGNDVGGFLAEWGEKCPLYETPSKKNPLIFPGTEMHKSSIPDDDRKHTLLLDQIQKWLDVVSPGAKVLFEKVMVGDRKRYVQSIAYGDRKFKPENVGFGVSYVLPVLTTLLTSHPGDIVIIENPEAHLHPKGQAKMGELLARAAAYGVQLFVETHSDHVVNGVRAAVKDGLVCRGDVGISYFERKIYEDEVCTEVRNIKVDSQGSLSEYPEGFMDEWNNQLMELID